MKHFVLGIDQGTTGTFVGLMNADGELVASADQPHCQIYPRPGWVEQDPLELVRNVFALVNRVMSTSGVTAVEIAGIGIANQGESIVMWDRRTGQPLYNVVVWQDARSQAAIEAMAAIPEIAQEVARRTGLKLDSYFSASKIRWLLDHVPEAEELISSGHLACGTLDTWLLWNMTTGSAFVTDVSTASRTLLFNIHNLDWDDWLLECFGIPREILPDVLPSTGVFGTVTHPELSCKGATVAASVVDQPAAMFGHGCLNAGQIKATYGTGCFINLNTGHLPVNSHKGLLTMLAWQREGHVVYGLDGGVFTAAASLDWLREQLGFFEHFETLDDLLSTCHEPNGVMWVPAQAGLGAPYWERFLRGAWLGIDLSTTRQQLVYAVYEGVAALVARIVETMREESGLPLQALRADGGLTASKTMMQIQANLLGIPVQVVANQEATAVGILLMAGRATGVWRDDESMTQLHIARTFEPSISEDQRCAYLEKFDRAINALKVWHAHD